MMEDFLGWCEERRKESADMLERLRSGDMKLGERSEPGPWTDTTPAWITRLEREIEHLDRLTAAVKSRP